MKKLKTLMLLAIVACALNASSQGFGVKYSTFGGKKDQRELKKVFISDFVVRQILRRNATAKAGGGLMGDPAYAHMTVDFGGVDKDAYQQMVTDVYKYTVDKFKGLGYEVVTGEEAKTKTDKELKVYPVGESENKDRVGLHSPIRPKDQLFYVNTSPFGGNAHSRLSKDLGAIGFTFTFQVEYVAYESSGGAFSMKAGLHAIPYLTVSQATTVVVPSGAGSLLMNPQKAPDDWVGPEGFTKVSKSNVSGSLFGSGNISSSSKYTVDINQDKYLGYLKDYLTKEIDASIDTWLQEIK